MCVLRNNQDKFLTIPVKHTYEMAGLITLLEEQKGTVLSFRFSFTQRDMKGNSSAFTKRILSEKDKKTDISSSGVRTF